MINSKPLTINPVTNPKFLALHPSSDPKPHPNPVCSVNPEP